jgi:hypothetical protein
MVSDNLAWPQDEDVFVAAGVTAPTDEDLEALGRGDFSSTNPDMLKLTCVMRDYESGLCLVHAI